MITAYITIIGLAMGSFVNALVWRLHNRLDGEGKKKSKKRPTSVLDGRSVCESCGHELNWQDLVPVFGWISLKGRCRYCNAKVPVQNPLVELGMAAAFGLSYVYWPLELDTFGWIHLIVWLALLVGLVTLIIYDLRWLMLPNAVIYPMIMATVALVSIEATIFDGGPDVIRDAVLGLFIIGGFFYTLFSFSKGKWIGGGDVKLAFFIGLLQGVTRGVVAIYTGFVTASLVIIPLLLAKKVNRKTAIPFGPFLILGIFVAELWGQDIVDWYDRTFLLSSLD